MEDRHNSLIDRATRRLSAVELRVPRTAMRGVDWRFAAALASVIALGPLATIVAAGVAERSALADATQSKAQGAPRLAQEARERSAREGLRRLVREPGVAVWLDRIASALPTEARVTRMARGGDGAVEMDVSTPDPDAIRVALRRADALTGFREIGQRRAGAMILVTYRRPA